MCYYGITIAVLQENEKLFLILIRYGSGFFDKNTKNDFHLIGTVPAFCIKLENGYFHLYEIDRAFCWQRKKFSFLNSKICAFNNKTWKTVRCGKRFEKISIKLKSENG